MTLLDDTLAEHEEGRHQDRVVPASDWVRLRFEDIKTGDWLKVVFQERGVYSERQGITLRKTSAGWLTEEGGVIVSSRDTVDIFRKPRKKRGWNLLVGMPAAIINKTKNLGKEGQ